MKTADIMTQNTMQEISAIFPKQFFNYSEIKPQNEEKQ